jgi:hypothetical protein
MNGEEYSKRTKKEVEERVYLCKKAFDIVTEVFISCFSLVSQQEIRNNKIQYVFISLPPELN